LDRAQNSILEQASADSPFLPGGIDSEMGWRANPFCKRSGESMQLTCPADRLE